MDSKKKSVIRRKWLTLEEKLKIIEANENGKTSRKIAGEQGMNESSVRCILRKKDFYKSLRSSTSFYRMKSFDRSLLLEKVEKQLIAWIKENNRKRIPLKDNEIKKKALAIFSELNKTGECKKKFSASQGWFYRFKSRVNLQNCVISGEKPSPDKEAVERFRLEFAKLIQNGGYNNHQIFNVEETILHWKRMSSENFQLGLGSRTRRYKPFRDSVTLLLGGNAAGDLKLKPLIVYRFKSCERNTLPVLLGSNKKSWLTKELFQEWFTKYFCLKVEKYCQDKGIEFKVLLLLDSAPSHEITKLHKNIRIVFLPQNTSCLLQPLTLGIFPLFKAYYLKQVFSQAASSKRRLQEFWPTYNIKKGIENILKCWNVIGSEELAGSWHQLLPDVKPKDFDSEVAAIIQDVVAMGEDLGLKVKKNQKDLDSDSDSPPTEEVICKEEKLDAFEDEYQDFNQDPNSDELEKIIQSINTTCELIAAYDLDTERSLEIQKVLQSGIQPYKDLYNEKTKVKCKCEINDL